MVSNICQRLLNKEWRRYELDRVPHEEGIYVIGILTGIPQFRFFGEPKVLYVGRTNDFHRRLAEHKRKNQKIDEFVKEEFEENDGEDLRIKWIKDENEDFVEKEYIECIARKLGYWPKYNIRR